MSTELQPRSATNARLNAEAFDASGFKLFSGGEYGQAHAFAHRYLDAGRLEAGRRFLGHWLRGRSGEGSNWIHLQFHMAVFEIGTGQWQAAYARCREQVLPAVAAGQDARTDAPQLLWRLALSAPGDVNLGWNIVREPAQAWLAFEEDPYVALHHLLALAGAEDFLNIERWLEKDQGAARGDAWRIVHGMAQGLAAYARKDYREAAGLMATQASRVGLVGGSRGQNQLFQQIAESAWRLCGTCPRPWLARAA